MIGFSQIIDNVGAEQQQSLNMVGQLGHSLIGLMDVVKMIWKIETKSYPLATKTFRVRSLLDAIKADVSPHVVGQHLSLEITHDSALPKTLTTDPVCLRQALSTLLHDALVQSERGILRCHVSPFLRNLNSYVRFEIKDFDFTGEQNPYQWSPNDSENEIDLEQLNVILAAKRMKLLGGCVSLSRPQGQKIRLTIDCPVQYAAKRPSSDSSSRSDKILSQISKNYSATRQTKPSQPETCETLDFSNTENFLG